MSLETISALNALSSIIGEYGYDGATKEGEPVEIGLGREHGHPIMQSRVVDGFKVKLHGDKLCIVHHLLDKKTKEFHENDPYDDCKSTIADIASFLQKEFRKRTGKSLGLKEDGKMHMDTQYVSKVRVNIISKQNYSVGALSDLELDSKSIVDDKLNKAAKKFLELSTEKKAKNDKSKKDSAEPFNPFKMSPGIRK
jgi:hypothetical protein